MAGQELVIPSSQLLSRAAEVLAAAAGGSVGSLQRRRRPRRAPVGGQPLSYGQIRHRGQFDDVGATPAVLSFLRDTWVSRMISLASRGMRGRERTAGKRRPGRARRRMYLFLCLSFVSLLVVLLAEFREVGALL